jgi:hypothetical protein
MEKRLNLIGQVPAVLNFNCLFDADFVDTIQEQMPGYDLTQLQVNHQRWLDKNSKAQWSLDSTIDSMTKKLIAMDWT